MRWQTSRPWLAVSLILLQFFSTEARQVRAAHLSTPSSLSYPCESACAPFRT